MAVAEVFESSMEDENVTFGCSLLACFRGNGGDVTIRLAAPVSPKAIVLAIPILASTFSRARRCFRGSMTGSTITSGGQWHAR